MTPRRKIDVAIIPARAGSVGVPGKNIRLLGGVPLISWSIQAAQASGVFDRIVVSTDCENIAEISARAGADVPFLRPKNLAGPTSTSVDVIDHALTELDIKGVFAVLQPTSPFRNGEHIREAADQLFNSPSRSLISVMQGKPLQWHYTINADQGLEPALAQDEFLSRRQDAAPVYLPNGAMYLCEVAPFFASRSLYHHDTLAYKMSGLDSLDIDEPDDFTLAEAIVQNKIRVLQTSQYRQVE